MSDIDVATVSKAIAEQLDANCMLISYLSNPVTRMESFVTVIAAVLNDAVEAQGTTGIHITIESVRDENCYFGFVLRENGNETAGSADDIDILWDMVKEALRSEPR